MRRADREIREAGKLRELVSRCKICRIAVNTGHAPYIVPMSPGVLWPQEKELPRLYFHSAASGRKLELFARDNLVGFEMEGNWALREGKTACAYGCAYESVVGWGRMTPVQEPQERRAALDAIMRTQTGLDGFQYDRQSLNQVVLLCLEVEEMSGKSAW